jgi:hypothetical protein
LEDNHRAIILRLPAHLIDRMDGIVHDLHCRSRSQFLRAALAAQVAHHERQLREKATANNIRVRADSEERHNCHIRSRLQDALILAPAKWSFERLEEIENSQMRRVEQETKRVPTECVATLPFLTRHAEAAVSALNLHIANQVKSEKKR